MGRRMLSPRVSAIVVNYRQPEITRRCLEALREDLTRLGEPWEIVVVDNGSGDAPFDGWAEAAPEAQVIALPDNLGFAGGAVAGIRRSSGEWIALINNDVLVERGAIGAMLAAGESANDVGSVAAQMRFAHDPGVINSAGIAVDRLGVTRDRLLGEPVSASEEEPVDVFGASGGAALHRRRMLEEVGGIDPSFFFGLEDADLAWRARMAGWRCVYAPAAVVHHDHGATGAHGSDLKYVHVGLNRVRTLAKNASLRQLLLYGPAIVAYDAAYVAYAAVGDRTLAPLRGRLRGLREWRTYRRAGKPRRPVNLEPARGLRAALGRRAVWRTHSDVNVRGSGGTLFVFHLGGVGGPARSLHPLATKLSKTGTVDTLVPEDGWVGRAYGELGRVTVGGYGALTYASGPREAARLATRLAREVRGFRRAFRRRRPERVIVVTTALPSAVIAARLERIPTAVYAAEIYDTSPGDARHRKLLGRLLARGTARLADAVICCSEAVARQFPRDSRAELAVAYPPIAQRPSADDGPMRQAGNGTGPCLVVAGALTRGRAQDVAIRTLALVRRRIPAARLLIVGAPHPRRVDIEFARELEELTHELGLADAVHFAGAVDEMGPVYAGADVVLNPARCAEAFGRVAPEALLAGRPVVATRVGALEEVIRHGETGLLVPPDDPEALAREAIRLLEDRELAGRLVAAGRDDVLRRFSEAADLAAWAKAIPAAGVRRRRGR
jgi:GT2 family glycosyltransferase/glycosyltransferase involved in cell wall biosynthesis